MRRALEVLAIGACLGIGGVAEAGEYYTCELANGRIEMRDIPCPAGARTLTARDVPEMTIEGGRPGEGSLPADGPGRVNVLPSPDLPVAPAPVPGEPPASPSPLGLEAFADPDWDPGFIERTLLQARFSAALSSLHNLRTASMMHQAEYGEWPADAEALGLDGTNMQTNEVSDVRFLPDGTILAELKPGFGTNKFIALEPVEELGGAQLAWRCRSNFPKQMFDGMFGAMCESRTIGGPQNRVRPGPAGGPAAHSERPSTTE